MKSRTTANGLRWKNFPRARPACRSMRIPVQAPPCPDHCLQHLRTGVAPYLITRETRSKAWIQYVKQPACLMQGRILAIRAMADFTLNCIEESAEELKHRSEESSNLLPLWCVPIILIGWHSSRYRISSGKSRSSHRDPEKTRSYSSCSD